jgi:hypothetical protein
VNWLEQIRQLGLPKAKPIRDLTEDELNLIHQAHTPWRADCARLDAEVKRLWLFSALTFTLSMCCLWYVLFH